MRQRNSANWIKRHFWIICADVVGAGLVISLLMAANGAPALKPAIFALLSLVPFTGLLVMLSERSARPVPQPAACVAKTRTIYTSPRPVDQRA
jgi:hypothetical protein